MEITKAAWTKGDIFFPSDGAALTFNADLFSNSDLFASKTWLASAHFLRKVTIRIFILISLILYDLEYDLFFIEVCLLLHNKFINNG